MNTNATNYALIADTSTLPGLVNTYFKFRRGAMGFKLLDALPRALKSSRTLQRLAGASVSYRENDYPYYILPPSLIAENYMTRTPDGFRPPPCTRQQSPVLSGSA